MQLIDTHTHLYLKDFDNKINQIKEKLKDIYGKDYYENVISKLSKKFSVLECPK